jgi:hypothetical protein
LNTTHPLALIVIVLPCGSPALFPRAAFIRFLIIRVIADIDAIPVGVVAIVVGVIGRHGGISLFKTTPCGLASPPLSSTPPIQTSPESGRYLHGLNSTPGGVKPTYLKDDGHTVFNPKLPDDDFDEAVASRIPNSDGASVNGRT